MGRRGRPPRDVDLAEIASTIWRRYFPTAVVGASIGGVTTNIPGLNKEIQSDARRANKEVAAALAAQERQWKLQGVTPTPQQREQALREVFWPYVRAYLARGPEAAREDYWIGRMRQARNWELEAYKEKDPTRERGQGVLIRRAKRWYKSYRRSQQP